MRLFASPMFDRALDSFARAVTQRRKLVLFGVLGVTILCATQLPNLQTDSAPEKLIVSFGGYEAEAREFRERFGNPDSVVALLVRADDVTARPALQYVHDLSLRFQREPRIERVESVTITPLFDADAPEESLDDLGEEPVLEPRFEAAIETLIASEPERFPMGLLTVAERVGGGELRGAVRGDDVTREEAAALETALQDSPLVVGRLVSRDRKLAAVVLFIDA